MAAKLLFLYLLAITGLAVVQAGMSTSQPLIRPVSWFIDGIYQIAPLKAASDHHHDNPNLNPNDTFEIGSLSLNPQLGAVTVKGPGMH
jgi:hypothetical protein